MIRGSQFYVIQPWYLKIELSIILWKQFNPAVLVRREKGIYFKIETGLITIVTLEKNVQLLVPKLFQITISNLPYRLLSRDVSN